MVEDIFAHGVALQVAGHDRRRPAVGAVEHEVLAEPAGLARGRAGFLQRPQKIVRQERVVGSRPADWRRRPSRRGRCRSSEDRTRKVASGGLVGSRLRVALLRGGAARYKSRGRATSAQVAAVRLRAASGSKPSKVIWSVQAARLLPLCRRAHRPADQRHADVAQHQRRVRRQRVDAEGDEMRPDDRRARADGGGRSAAGQSAAPRRPGDEASAIMPRGRLGASRRMATIDIGSNDITAAGPE